MSNHEVSDKDTVAECCMMILLNCDCVKCKIVTYDTSSWVVRRKEHIRETYHD